MNILITLGAALHAADAYLRLIAELPERFFEKAIASSGLRLSPLIETPLPAAAVELSRNRTMAQCLASRSILVTRSSAERRQTVAPTQRSVPRESKPSIFSRVGLLGAAAAAAASLTLVSS